MLTLYFNRDIAQLKSFVLYYINDMSGRKKILVIFLLLSCLILSASFLYFVKKPAPPTLPQPIAQQVKFTIFLPHSTEYTIEPNSYAFQNNVLSFRLITPSGSQLFVSQQPEPANFDFQDFHNKLLKERRTSSSPNGDVHLGKVENNKVGSMLSSSTWVYVSGPTSTDYKDIESLFTRLKRLKDL